MKSGTMYNKRGILERKNIIKTQFQNKRLP